MNLEKQTQLYLAMLSHWPPVAIALRELENEIRLEVPASIGGSYSVAVWVRNVGSGSVALLWG